MKPPKSHCTGKHEQASLKFSQHVDQKMFGPELLVFCYLRTQPGQTWPNSGWYVSRLRSTQAVDRDVHCEILTKQTTKLMDPFTSNISEIINKISNIRVNIENLTRI